MVLYLKYRPQNLNDLVGQEQVKKNLTNAFIAGKLSHAYLFVGPRGTGKTSTARILAKMVNCQGLESSDKSQEKQEKSRLLTLATSDLPCNQCSSCTSITDGSSLDLIEIDAASNRGIDDIRTLRENIKLAPAFSKKKVYIIDEVHMLTTEAFNALLKTLEEPPAHALFILATTDVEKVPQTILSRVQRLDFQLATPTSLQQALDRVIKEEKIDIDQEALKILIKKAEGSFRDAIKMLDQISSTGTKITVEEMMATFSAADFEASAKLLNFLAEKNVQESLLLINAQSKTGIDMKNWMISLQEMSRSLIFIKNGLGEVLVEPEYSEAKYKGLKFLADKFALEDLIKLTDLLQKAIEKLKFSSIPSLPLELAVVEGCLESFDSAQDKSVKRKALSDQKQQSVILNEVKDLPSLVNNPAPEDSSSTMSPQNDKEKVDIATLSPMVSPQSDDQNYSPSASDDVISAEVALLQEKWNFVLETVKPYNFSLEALLRLVKIVNCNDGVVLLEVPYSFHQRILEAPKSRDLLESVLADVLGKPTKVSCVLSSKPLKAEDVSNVEVAADDEIIRVAAEIFGTDTN